MFLHHTELGYDLMTSWQSQNESNKLGYLKSIWQYMNAKVSDQGQESHQSDSWHSIHMSNIWIYVFANVNSSSSSGFFLKTSVSSPPSSVNGFCELNRWAVRSHHVAHEVARDRSSMCCTCLKLPFSMRSLSPSLKVRLDWGKALKRQLDSILSPPFFH